MGDDEEITEEEIRAALAAVHSGDASLSDVLCLAAASDEWEPALVPSEVVDAVAAKYQMDGDVANGGLDQLAWNQGVEAARAYASALRAVGAIENADVLDRLASDLEKYEKKHSRKSISADPIKHFLAYRKSVGGPEFGIPEHGDELAEVVVEYVIAHAKSIPTAKAKLGRKDQ